MRRVLITWLKLLAAIAAIVVFVFAVATLVLLPFIVAEHVSTLAAWALWVVYFLAITVIIAIGLSDEPR